jgi:outer membrane lipoprotein carrier protein
MHKSQKVAVIAGMTRLGCALLGAALVGVGPRAAAPVRADASADDAGARGVAAAVQAFYDQTKDVSATFSQTYVNKLYQRTDRSTGRVVFKKPGMMRWDYDKPNGKVIASNGKRLVVFEPGEDGDKGQVVEQEISQAQLPQAMAFLMGTGKLVDDFDVRLLDAKSEGYANGDVLELRPKQPTPHYQRILFFIERTPALRGLVRRLLIIDASGNRNRFDFTAIKFNVGASDQPFNYVAPEGARRVQL